MAMPVDLDGLMKEYGIPSTLSEEQRTACKIKPKPIAKPAPMERPSLKPDLQLFAKKAGAESRINSLDRCYFRGTSEGYKGNNCLQRLKITPVSTDPLVATLFATEAEQYGEGVLHIAEASLLKEFVGESNTLATLEKEVGINLSPSEFADKATLTISAKSARGILSRMGFNLPDKIYSPAQLDNTLRLTPRLTKEQINEFLKNVSKEVLN